MDWFTPTEVHALLREQAARFARERLGPRAEQADREERFDRDLFSALGQELGLFGVMVPEEYGGAGLDLLASVAIIEELSREDPGFALSYLAHDLLFVYNLYVNGSHGQRARYLPKVISGGWLAGLAMTGPESGSDVLGMRCRARRDGDHYILTGTKQFVTNVTGDVFLVYARTGDGPRDISAFVVEATSPGVHVGRLESKLGMRSSPTGQLVFDQTPVPVENRLGEEGRGLVGMMRNLEVERIGLAAQSIGIASRCVDEMVAFGRERRSFGRSILDHGQVQRLVADSYASTQAARSLVCLAASKVCEGGRNRLLADSAKLLAARTGEQVARAAVQVLGGYGYCRDYPVERLLRDAILISIGGGTNEMMEKNITRELTRR